VSFALAVLPLTGQSAVTALVQFVIGIGAPPGPAVSAVLTYRLATYWLPVVPGWAALRLLQGRGYV